PGDGLGLRAEADSGLMPGVLTGQDHLQRDGAVEPDVSGLVDDPHTTTSQLALDLVAGDDGITPSRGKPGSVARSRPALSVGGMADGDLVGPRRPGFRVLRRFRVKRSRFDRGLGRERWDPGRAAGVGDSRGWSLSGGRIVG